MDLNLLGWVLTIASVPFFLLLEKIYNKDKSIIEGRYKTIFSIQTSVIIMTLLCSTVLLTPFVILIAPLEIFSFSQLQMPRILNICLSFLLIDFFLYLTHLLHHKIPVLWKLHRLHHSDKKVDALTTWLHHPLEIVTTFVILFTLYVMFDLAVIVLVIYSIVFAIHTAFTHFNILVPEQIDKYLRRIIVTPNAHRVHHSLNTKEEKSNYGQIFLFWDWIFGTYIYRSNEVLKQMNYGIDDNQTPKKTSFYDYLINPLK